MTTSEQRRWLSPIRERRFNRERVFLDSGAPLMECVRCGRWLRLPEFLKGIIPFETCNRCRGVIVKPEECPECGGEVTRPASWNQVEQCCTTCVPRLD